jgi:hypothetical protein
MTTVNSPTATSNWFVILVAFAQQVQLMIGSAWSMSFMFMSNVGQLERLKEVIEQFNQIVLDPTHNLIQTMGSDVTLYVDTKNNRAFMDSGLNGMSHSVKSTELSGQVRMSLIRTSKRYSLTREKHEYNGMYVFAIGDEEVSECETDQVLINGKASSIQVESVHLGTFTHNANHGTVIASYDTGGTACIKLSALTKDTFDRNISIVNTWQQQLISKDPNLVFIRHLRSFVLEDDRQKTIRVCVDQNVATKDIADTTTQNEEGALTVN